MRATACVVLALMLGPLLTAARAQEDEKTCAGCHARVTPGIVQQWRDSAHGAKNVECLSCHLAEKGEPDAYEHYGETIATIVSPKDCSVCHPKQAGEFAGSRHARGAEFIGSVDNILGERVEGTPAAVSGCRQCHGSIVKVGADGRPDPATWPNSGIGRVNPDGSKGSCTACHARHGFSAAQGRRPEGCGRCHMGPDHPHIEIFNESKHGILFAAHQDEMNLDSKEWVVGRDYTAAPTCATCHTGATPNQPATHDPGLRISWTLRPVISVRQDNWEQKRKAMQDVCMQCHAEGFVQNFYTGYDDAVQLYNEKFAKPAKAVMDRLYAEGRLTKTAFDERIEWTFFELWHHEGRRARHGAAMMGPDYTQWHGFYEVAKNFYTEFLPQAEEIEPGVSKEFLAGDYHKWLRAGATQPTEE
jgi:hydroxylamine dehydrogenase